MIQYADRAFVSVNGAPLLDLQSASLKTNQNSKAVPSMTNDRFNRGAVFGNIDIDIDVEVAVQQLLASPKLETLPYASSDVRINFQCGADLYVATGVYLKNSDQNASGVGSEAKKTFSLGALKLVDSVGNSVLFDIQL